MLCSTRSVSGKCQQQKPQQQPEAFAEVVDGKKSFFLFPLASVRFFYRYKKNCTHRSEGFFYFVGTQMYSGFENSEKK